MSVYSCPSVDQELERRSIASRLPFAREVLRSIPLGEEYRICFIKEDVWLPAISRRVLAFQKGWIEVWRRQGTGFRRMSSLYLGEESWWDETAGNIQISTRPSLSACLAIPVPSANIPRTSMVVLNPTSGRSRLVETFLGSVHSIGSGPRGFNVNGQSVRLTGTKPARTGAREFKARIDFQGRITVVEGRL